MVRLYYSGKISGENVPNQITNAVYKVQSLKLSYFGNPKKVKLKAIFDHALCDDKDCRTRSQFIEKNEMTQEEFQKVFLISED